MHFPSFGGGSTGARGGAKPSSGDVSASGGGAKSGASDKSPNDNISGKFDPTALERGAKALRDLDASPNAQKAFEITKLQELTRQKEVQKEMEQIQASRYQMQAERARIEADEKRKTTAHQHEQERVTAQYKAQLEAEAYAKKLQDQQKQNERCLEQQHQQFLRQEEIRKANEKQLLEMKREQMREEKAMERELLKAKMAEETRGRIQQERENVDVRLREMRARAAEDRKTRLESIQTTLSTVGAACTTFLDDKEKVTTTVAAVSALAVGVYGARAGTGVAGRYIVGGSVVTFSEAQEFLDEPWASRLACDVRKHGWESPPLRVLFRNDVLYGKTFTHETGVSFQKHWKTWVTPWWRNSAFQLKEQSIVLPSELSQRLQWTANSLIAAKRNGTPFRHLLLYGHPGTGKTLFARTLARESGMDYAIMAGGDIGPLGKDAVAEVNKLFKWANQSKKGLILFVDEAEAFLRQGRGGLAHMSEETRNVLSTFLHHTGTESDKFCVILATNIKDVLDRAILDRMDDQFEFPLPGLTERRQLVKLFFDQYIYRPTHAGRTITVASDVDDRLLEMVAHKTEGFSGRQLAKLVIAMQAAVFGSGTNTLTKGLAESVLQWKLAHLHEDQEMAERARTAHEKKDMVYIPSTSHSAPSASSPPSSPLKAPQTMY